VLGRPSRPKNRTQPTKLEITFGHVFDRRRYRRPKALCARAFRPSSISHRGARRTRGVGRRRKTCRGTSRSPFFHRVATLRKRYVPAAIVPLAGQFLRHLRVEQGEAAFSRRLRARRRRRAFQAGSLPDCPGYRRGKRGEPCVWTNGDGCVVLRACRSLPPQR
jgi:hypothetical protein